MKIDYESIIKLINEALSTKKLYLLNEGDVELPSSAKILKYIEKNNSNAINELKVNIANYREDLLFRIRMLKEFIENNEVLDTPEKLSEYISLAQVAVETNVYGLNLVSLCGLKGIKRDDFNVLLSVMILDNLNVNVGTYYYYNDRIKSYGLDKRHSYFIHNKEYMIKFIDNTQITGNGKKLDYSDSKKVFLEIIDYMEEHNYVMNVAVMRSVRKNVFKDYIDALLNDSGEELEINFNKYKKTIKNNRQKESQEVVENMFEEIDDIEDETIQLLESIDLSNVDPIPKVKAGSNTSSRDKKVSDYTKERARDKDGIIHCELCDHMMDELDYQISNAPDEVTSSKLIGYKECILERSRSKRKSSFNSHHIKYLSKGGHDHIYNTICLCYYCHANIHNNKIFIDKHYKTVLDILKKNLEEKNPEYLDKYAELFEENYKTR